MHFHQIEYQIPKLSFVKIKVYDILGEEISAVDKKKRSEVIMLSLMV